MKFTAEIKQNWLNALKSGKYKQGFLTLHDKETNTHCCIGVLGEVVEGLDNDVRSINEMSPYNFLTKTIGEDLKKDLYYRNDAGKGDPEYTTRDYSNVIPLIESLPVQE